jgi:hypothetical protein
MPSATGQNWEKYQKKFADDDEPEKKITPLSDECVISKSVVLLEISFHLTRLTRRLKGYPST